MKLFETPWLTKDEYWYEDKGVNYWDAMLICKEALCKYFLLTKNHTEIKLIADTTPHKDRIHVESREDWMGVGVEGSRKTFWLDDDLSDFIQDEEPRRNDFYVECWYR